MRQFRRRMSRASVIVVLVALGSVGAAAAMIGVIGPGLGIINNGRHLTPYGTLAKVGNVPTGGAVTPDGRFYWTVSAGSGFNDVRILSVAKSKVIQVLPLPGASGGITADPRGGRMYVSGLANSTNAATSRPSLPGGGGDVIHVFSYSRTTGKAHELAPIAVRPPSFAKPPQDFPLTGSKTLAYPEHLAISPNGRTLLVPLGLASAAAIVDVASHRVRYVATGDYPYGAAILPDGRRGLVTNEAPGTVSVIDLTRARKLKDIVTGGHLAHPEAVIAPRGGRAYVAVTDRDRVAVIDTQRLHVERYLSVGNRAGIGTSPDALAVSADGRRLLVAEAGSDEVTVLGVPARGGKFSLQGRIPVARYPTDVQVTAGRHPKLLWLSAKGLGTGPNPNGPSPFNSGALGQSSTPTQFLPYITDGDTGVAPMPTTRQLVALTRKADAQVVPANHVTTPPAGTPLRAGGPIKYVFFIVRENRTYDQILGDDARGDGDPKLTLFGANTTPNLHALVKRFPLIDHFYADSEASMQGHQWTSAGNINDFTEKNWNQISSVFGSYGARGRPLEPGLLAVSWPKNGYLFDQALRQGISFFNYGEIFAGDTPLPNAKVALIAHLPDVDRNAADQAEALAKFNRSDLGPGVNNGCFPNAAYAATDDILTGKSVFDSTVPPGAPAGAESRVDCFRSHFAAQLAAGQVPAFNYITLPNDHTQGLKAGARTPQAMIADNDLATAQIVDTISHSSIWAHSAIFIVEDDSQDGADHVDAHRTVAAVVSPYARPGAVVHTRYDQLSMLRSMELILGMHPLSLNDALATPMYDVVQSTPAGLAPYDALPETRDLLATNPAGTAGAKLSAAQDFADLDAVPQHTLDNILWMSVHGPKSTPPPPGPNATTGTDES
jgi:DNA-binding beta-propeller fold protein YncE